MGGRSVIIIGAGAAGLAAAFELAHTGHQVRILEGRNRIGGRLHTIRTSQGALPIELGAEFLHGENVPTWRFVRAANLATHEVPDRHWDCRHGRPKEDPAFADALSPLTDPQRLPAADLTFNQFLGTVPDLSDEQQRRLLEYVEGFHAADPAQISVHAIAAAEKAAAELEGSRQFRITSGYQALVAWFASQLTQDSVRLHMHCTAKCIRWRPGSVEVDVEEGEQKNTYPADAAIITVPLGILQENAAENRLHFSPALGAHREALNALAFGNVTKLILQFRKRFWPEENFGFLHSCDEWFPTWWADERGFLLTAWAGGPRADLLAARDESFAKAQAMRALATMFDTPPSHLENELEAIFTHPWARDPFSRGAYSYVRAGGAGAVEQLAEPISQTLFIAGEATAPHGQLGTVHGALESGRRAALALLRSP